MIRRPSSFPAPFAALAPLLGGFVSSPLPPSHPPAIVLPALTILLTPSPAPPHECINHLLHLHAHPILILNLGPPTAALQLQALSASRFFQMMFADGYRVSSQFPGDAITVLPICGLPAVVAVVKGVLAAETPAVEMVRGAEVVLPMMGVDEHAVLVLMEGFAGLRAVVAGLGRVGEVLGGEAGRGVVGFWEEEWVAQAGGG